MKKFSFILILVIINACCGSSKTQEKKTPEVVYDQKELNLEGKYEVAQLSTEKEVKNDVFLNFEKGRISGNTGCNNFSAQFSRNENQISFSPIMATKRHCEGQMDVEKEIFSALSKTEKIRSTSEDEIVLISAEGKELLKLNKMKMK